MDGKAASWATSWATSWAASWGVAAVSGGAIVGAMALAFWWRAQLPPPSAAPAVAAAESSASASPAAALVQETTPPSKTIPAPEAPRADVVRVLPNGEVVVAGRASPGARVALLDNGQTVMETQADPTTGEFVFLPPRLAAGQHQLALKEAPRATGGQSPQRNLTAFAIAPEAKREQQPMAAALAAAPGPTPAPASAAASPSAAMLAEAAREARTIARGDTLWRISREKLGRGSLYDLIVRANAGKIRDPNLIYPGQSLDIPHRD